MIHLIPELQQIYFTLLYPYGLLVHIKIINEVKFNIDAWLWSDTDPTCLKVTDICARFI